MENFLIYFANNNAPGKLRMWVVRDKPGGWEVQTVKRENGKKWTFRIWECVSYGNPSGLP